MVPSVYRAPGQVFSVTIATAARSPFFTDVAFGHECVSLLRAAREAGRFCLYAYCLMPDHVHLLVGIGPGSDLTAEIGRWKSLCTLARRRRGLADAMWQRSFYDHALRKEEDVRVAARYILENPVRAGLVSRIEEYPLSGSFEFESLRS
jgi:putative transposase